jgi:hypothetical protein
MKELKKEDILSIAKKEYEIGFKQGISIGMWIGAFLVGILFTLFTYFFPLP